LGNTVTCNDCGEYFVLGEETEEYHLVSDTGYCSMCRSKMGQSSNDWFSEDDDD